MFSISLILPVLNEAHTIQSTLEHLVTSFPDCEIIVVDGGSSDNTVALAKPYARILVSEKGRANQMNAGAAASSGDIMWFIHADTHVDREALHYILAALKKETVIGGGLTLQFVEDSKTLRLIAKLSNFRARCLQWIFGDQSMFVRRKDFEAVGGFPALPIMEDLEISRLLKMRGKLVVLPTVSKTSARRFIEHGPWKTIFLMQLLKLKYLLGVHPDEILRQYSNPHKKKVRAE